jgi:hypothetical protein
MKNSFIGHTKAQMAHRARKAHSLYLIYFVVFAYIMNVLRVVMAENGGFEPPIELSPYNGLANRRLQPLGQLSVCVAWAPID